jgi:hypothetical protein
VIAKRKGEITLAARRGLKEARNKGASRCTKTGSEAYGGGPPGGLPLSGKQAVDARSDFLMGNVLAPIERVETSLCGLDEASLMLQIESKHFLRQFIRVPSFAEGKSAQFRFLLASEVDFHNRESRRPGFNNLSEFA